MTEISLQWKFFNYLHSSNSLLSYFYTELNKKSSYPKYVQNNISYSFLIFFFYILIILRYNKSLKVVMKSIIPRQQSFS